MLSQDSKSIIPSWALARESNASPTYPLLRPMFIQSFGCRVKHSKRLGALDVRWVEGQSTRSLNEAWFLDNALARSGFFPLSKSVGIDEMLARVNQKARKIITQKLTQVLYNNSPFVTSLVPSFETQFRGPPEVMVRDKPPGISLRTGDSTIAMLSLNRRDSIRSVHELRSEMAKLAKLTRNLRITLHDISVGPQFTRDWLSSNSDVKGMSARISNNGFEQTVVKIVKQISGSFVSNIQVVFDNPPESHEYDLIIPMTADLGFNIEVMDYPSVQKDITQRDSWRARENLKSVILLRTKDKTLRLGPDVQLVVILRGFKKDIFSEIFKIARSRKIVLLNESALGAKLWVLMEYGLMSLFRDRASDFWPLMDKYNTKMFEFDSTLKQ